MQLIYGAQFEQDPMTGAYVVSFPDLPGCVSGGQTLIESMQMATDAASGWILDELEDGRPAPAPTPLNAMQPNEGCFISALLLDMDAYAEKYGIKSVRKNLTIPAWLNTFAEKNNINYSQVLQEALSDLYRQQMV